MEGNKEQLLIWDFLGVIFPDILPKYKFLNTLIVPAKFWSKVWYKIKNVVVVYQINSIKRCKRTT